MEVSTKILSDEQIDILQNDPDHDVKNFLWSQEKLVYHDKLQWILAYDPKENVPSNRAPKLKVMERDRDISEDMLYTFVELGPLNYKKLIFDGRLHFGKKEDGSFIEVVRDKIYYDRRYHKEYLYSG